VTGKSENGLGNSNSNWLARFRVTQGHAACRDHDPTFGPVFVSGAGAKLRDVEGNEWLDLTCGYSAANFGHAYEPLVAKAREQLGQLTHLTGEPHTGRIELAERLIDICKTSAYAPSSVIFNSTGARAVETAWKAADGFRPGKMLVLSPGFHGRSIATAALSETKRTDLSSLVSERVITWPASEYAYCARCPLELQYPSCSTRCIDRLLAFIQEHKSQISAILVEPALGARGYIFPPAEYFQKLREVTEKLGILLIADEIQTGLGRCGNPLMANEQGWRPDLAILGKSLGGGIVPISAVVGRSDVLDCIPQGAESETFAATPLACAVALRGLELLDEHDLFKRGKAIGLQLRKALIEEFRSEKCGTGRRGMDFTDISVEGTGACCVVEFASGSRDPGHGAELAREFVMRCVDQRIRVHWTGPVKTRVVLLPPLTMTDSELAEAVDKIKLACS